MTRKQFIGLTSGAILAVGAATYGFSDKRNLTRANLISSDAQATRLKADESEILYLASLAPSGHNTQPWFVHYLEPYHWVIGNDSAKWLPAVDPNQRETMLSLGAFLQNLEYAAAAFGYACQWTLLAAINQDKNVMEVKLVHKGSKHSSHTPQIKDRRTVRSGFLNTALKQTDLDDMVETDSMSYLPADSQTNRLVSELTIEANRIQAYRDPAQMELADWIRFSSKDACKYRDGLSTAGMEIGELPGWMVRNFYGYENVLKNSFREQGIDLAGKEARAKSGWILITSKNETVESLLETGRCMQRLFLKVRQKNIGLHPMTQILEETSTRQTLQKSIGLDVSIQFILRTGYLKNYPAPVSLRRPVGWFLRS